MSEMKISFSHFCVDGDRWLSRDSAKSLWIGIFSSENIIFFVRRGGSSVRQIKHENIFTGVILQQHAQFDGAQNNTILEIQDYINK